MSARRERERVNVAVYVQIHIKSNPEYQNTNESTVATIQKKGAGRREREYDCAINSSLSKHSTMRLKSFERRSCSIVYHII